MTEEVKLLAVLSHLRETFTTQEACEAWLMHPNVFLGSKRPIEMIMARNYDLVENALEALDSGIFI